MIVELFDIVCALCACHFRSDALKEDEILCEYCGHSLDDDHAAGQKIEIDIAEAS